MKLKPDNEKIFIGRNRELGSPTSVFLIKIIDNKNMLLKIILRGSYWEVLIEKFLLGSSYWEVLIEKFLLRSFED
jgi:hypothetical protein